MAIDLVMRFKDYSWVNIKARLLRLAHSLRNVRVLLLLTGNGRRLRGRPS